jgi:hypothetical protein
MAKKIIDGVEWQRHKGEWISVEHRAGEVRTRHRPAHHPAMMGRWERFKYWLFRGEAPDESHSSNRR